MGAAMTRAMAAAMARAMRMPSILLWPAHGQAKPLPRTYGSLRLKDGSASSTVRQKRGSKTLSERIDVDAWSGCWEWNGAPDSHGYGRFYGNGSNERAHRAVFEMFVGPIPAGMVLDHLCRNRICVNPEHLDPTSQAENVKRGVSPIADQAVRTHCPRGHEYDEANTYIGSAGKRNCRACRRVEGRRR